MKILTLDEAGVRFGGKVFRTRVMGSLVGVVIVIAMLAGLIIGYVKGEVPVGVLIVAGLILGLVFLMTLSVIRRDFSGENWLMVLSPQEVLIKYRSYLNNRMSRNDRQVFVLELDEIAGVRKVKRKEITISNKGGKQYKFMTFFDIMLSEPVGEEVKEALIGERLAKEDRKAWYGKTSSKYSDYPVSVVDEDILRVRMSSIRPGIKGALEWFGSNGIEEQSLHKEEEDFTATVEDKAQMDDKILRLAMGGQKMAAIKLARRAFGMGLSEAKDYVEGLME